MIVKIIADKIIVATKKMKIVLSVSFILTQKFWKNDVSEELEKM